MAENSYSISTSWAADGGTAQQVSYTKSGGGKTRLSETIPGGSTNLALTFTCDVSAAKVIVISANRDVLLETNDGTTPDATVNLKAGVPLVWTNDGYFTNPFGSTDVTALFATLAAGEDSELVVEVLYDPTP